MAFCAEQFIFVGVLNVTKLLKIFIMDSYLFLETGFEEIEAISCVDVLRRAGMKVETVSITGEQDVQGAHGVTVKADKLFEEIVYDDIQWLILPGGLPGASNLAEYKPLSDLLISHSEKGGEIAAICAAPALVLGALGLLEGRVATCYPGFEDKLGGAKYSIDPVVVDRNIITANGPSTAFDFALAIVSKNFSQSFAYEIAAGMLLYPQRENFYF